MAERIVATLKEMADAIREKTGDTEKIKGKDLPEAIRNISAAGLTPYGIYYDTFNSDGNITKMTFFGEQLPAVYYMPTSCTVIELNETVKKIPENFLKQNTKVTEVKLTDNVEDMGTYAFAYMENNLKTLTLQDGTTNRIPKGMTTIPDYAFNRCSAITPGISWHNDVKIIGKSAFCNCRVADHPLPENLEEIRDSAFSPSTTMVQQYYVVVDLVIPEKVKTIGNWIFLNHQTLKTITFKGTPETIGQYAFQGITNLTTINVPWSEGAVANAPWGAGNATINYNYTGG